MNIKFLDLKTKVIKDLGCQKPELIREKSWYGGCSIFNEALIQGAYIFSNSDYYKDARNNGLGGGLEEGVSQG
jgi:hypothetical protein